MPDIALELQGVTKRFGNFTAVDNLSLTLERGRILGFLGPNGAGKTTTLRMMLGIYKPDSGRARLLGSSIARVRERIGYLPEERGLYKRMRAENAIAYIATLKGVKRSEAFKRARELLDHFGLGPFARVRIEGLSKGMSQKVQLLAAIAHNPDFAILDEPFSGLDPVNQSDLVNFLRSLASNGKTILFSTHTMEHAERLCDQLVIMTRGRKVFDGTLGQARALMPRRARIAAACDLNFLADVPGVTAVTAPKDGSEFWEIDLKEGAEGQPLLAACFERGIALTHFDISPPSLHDVFMALAGRSQS